MSILFTSLTGATCKSFDNVYAMLQLHRENCIIELTET